MLAIFITNITDISDISSILKLRGINMEQGKIVKGNNLANFLLTNKDYSLWTHSTQTGFETEVHVSEVDLNKWYYISRFEKSTQLYIVEIDFIGSDVELRNYLR
jgi:hypothetical protein